MKEEYENIGVRLAKVVQLCAAYCSLLENAREMVREEFISQLCDLLPRIYWEFCDLVPTTQIEEFAGLMMHLDEEYYDMIRMRLQKVMGEDDTYLDTLHHDMKYSDTPIAVSVSEGLADIFQPLYNFVEEVRKSGADSMMEAYLECRMAFNEYWSDSLCAVLRPLNLLRQNG